jgi:hypothetical protein
LFNHSPHKADMNPKAAMDTSAGEADVDAIRHGGPGGILCWAIEANLDVTMKHLASRTDGMGSRKQDNACKAYFVVWFGPQFPEQSVPI